MSDSKHQAMQEWVDEFLENNYLYFQSVNAEPGVRMVLPEYGDYTNRTDILGYKYKSYVFVFIGYEQIDTGTSDVNLHNMELMDSFIEWLEEQIEDKNYPDFGDNCDEYEIQPLQNMADLATITEDGLAKYMLGVRINYREE